MAMFGVVISMKLQRPDPTVKRGGRARRSSADSGGIEHRPGHMLAAVAMDDFAVDEVTGIAGEKQRRRADVLHRIAEPAQRQLAHHHVEHPGASLVAAAEFRRVRQRQQQVGGNLVFPPVERRGTNDPDQAPGRVMIGASGYTERVAIYITDLYYSKKTSI